MFRLCAFGFLEGWFCLWFFFSFQWLNKICVTVQNNFYYIYCWWTSIGHEWTNNWILFKLHMIEKAINPFSSNILFLGRKFLDFLREFVHRFIGKSLRMIFTNFHHFGVLKNAWKVWKIKLGQDEMKIVFGKSSLENRFWSPKWHFQKIRK